MIKSAFSSLCAALLCFGLVLAAGPSLAQNAVSDEASELPVLRIGLVSGGDDDRELARRDPFRAYLEAALDLPVEFTVLNNYRTLIDAQLSSRIDYAIYSSTAYLMASSLCDCVDPIVVPANGDQIGYFAILLARADSHQINGLEDLTGRTVLLGRSTSVAGSILPKSALEEKSIVAMLQSVEAGMTAAVARLVRGEGDAAAAWSSLGDSPQDGFSAGTLAQMTRAGALSPEQVKIIWRSRLIPHGPHVVRRSLPPLLKLDLIEALLNIPTDDPYLVEAAAFPHGGPFREVRPEIFEPLRDSLGIPVYQDPGTQPALPSVAGETVDGVADAVEP